MEKHIFSPLKPSVVLGVAAHPDDLEFGVAGSMAKFISEGAKGYYLILTNANKGTGDRSMEPARLTEIRREEQRQAGKILSLTDIFFCDYDDGYLECSLAVKRDICRAIRTVKPDVVIAMDPSFLYSSERGFINHPDHRAAGQAALDAVYPLSRDHLAFPELLAEGLEPHEVATMLLLNLDRPDYMIDISQHMDTKLQALGAHTSQVPNPEATFAMVRSWAESLGSKVGAKYAEGFVRIDVR